MRTRCSVLAAVVAPLAPVDPSTRAVASAKPISLVFSSSVLAAAAERLALVDPSTRAMASVELTEVPERSRKSNQSVMGMDP